MNDLERLLNAAISTQWTISPAVLVLACCAWSAAWNRVRAK